MTTEAPVVQTSSTEMGALIDREIIAALPLNAWDIQQLAVLQPGVQSQAAYTGLSGANITVRGARPEQNQYLLDGVDTGTSFGTAPVSAGNIMMGVEALQEFKVLTSLQRGLRHAAGRGDQHGHQGRHQPVPGQCVCVLPQ